VLALGNFEIPDSPQGAKLYELKADGLEARFFGGVTLEGDNASSSNNPSSGSGSGSGSGSLDERELMQTAVGDGMIFKGTPSSRRPTSADGSSTLARSRSASRSASDRTA
jgi:hypothetical protein